MIEIPLHIVLFALLTLSVVAFVFLLGYLCGKAHNPTWSFDGDLEKRALIEAEARTIQRILDVLSQDQEEEGKVLEMK